MPRKTKEESTPEKLVVDLTPIKTFRYSQISNYNFQFLLLDENNRAVHTPFMCKDYLQDIFYTEHTGVSADIYGIRWEQGMFNIGRETYRMLLMGGTFNLSERLSHIKSFTNAFESALGIPHSEFIETSIDHNIAVDFNKEWTVNGPMLSAYTTILRISGMYNTGEDVIEYLKDLLVKIKQDNSGIPNYMKVEIHRLTKTINRLAALLQGKRPEHNWSDFKNVQYVHDTGIFNFALFPEVKV